MKTDKSNSYSIYGPYGLAGHLALLLLLVTLFSQSTTAAGVFSCDAGPIVNVSPYNATVGVGGIVFYNVTMWNNNSYRLCEPMHIRLQFVNSSTHQSEFYPGGNWTNYTIANGQNITASAAITTNSSTPLGSYSFHYRALTDNDTAFNSNASYITAISIRGVGDARLSIENVSWHCYSGKTDRGQFCRPEDILEISSITFKNAGGRAYSGVIRIQARNDYGLRTNSIVDSYTDKITDFPINTTLTVPPSKEGTARTSFVSNISATYSINIAFTPFPPDEEASDNYYNLSITTQFYKGCQYSFPPCPEGFACRENLCERSSQNATPRPPTNISAPTSLPTTTPLPTVEEIPSVAPATPTPTPTFQPVGASCLESLDCASGVCKDGRCAPEPGKSWLDWISSIIHGLLRAIGLE